MSKPPRSHHMHVVACPTCALVCRHLATAGDPPRCPRCHSRLHRRRPRSIEHAWALLIAALVFYIPANFLPVMQRSQFGTDSTDTLLSGVLEFWRLGSYGIALLIFIVSVVIPCLKFLVLGLLLASTQRRSAWAVAERARMHRLTELVGYWSLLDIVVVAVMSALIRFQAFGDVAPRIGILFFGMVVILTMLANMVLDPRLIWDGEEQ